MLKLLYFLILLTACQANLFGLMEDIDDGRVWNFKVEVAAGDMDCYYQEIRPGEVVSAEFDTVRSDDNSWDMTVTVTNEATSEQLYHTEGMNGDFYDESQLNSTSENGAVYKLCLDNSLDGNFKHVTFQFSAYRPGWGRYMEEIEKLDIQSSVFISKIQTVSENVRRLFSLIYHWRAQDCRGYLISAVINDRVMFWSTINFIGIIAAALTQVYFIRNLFANAGSSR